MRRPHNNALLLATPTLASDRLQSHPSTFMLDGLLHKA